MSPACAEANTAAFTATALPLVIFSSLRRILSRLFVLLAQRLNQTFDTGLVSNTGKLRTIVVHNPDTFHVHVYDAPLALYLLRR